MPLINNYLYSQKGPSDRIGFDYIYQTFFYNIYSKYDEKTDQEIFYMASEDKESILSRLDFYKNYIVDIEYPIIDKRGRPEYVAGNSPLAMLYVLSLPEECFKIKDKEEYLSPETAIERIIFLDSLNSRKENTVVTDCFLSDKYYQKITNHLISRGFYFLNIESLSTNSSQIPFEKSPFIINESKFLAKYDIATSERIYLSFSRVGLITPEEYVQYFKKIDSLSLQEQINYAFDLKENDNEIEYSVKIGLIEYYFAILRRETRELFDLHLNQNTLKIKRSVIDYECGNHFLKYNYFAYGTHFSLVATNNRCFSKKKDVITEYIKPSIYKLLPQDINRLKFYYNSVKHYLDLNQEYRYMPHLFIKLLGLPYEVINLTKNFNFKEGTAEDFIKLIPIADNSEFIKYKLANLDGFIIEYDEDKINYILNDLSNKELYVFNYDEEVFFNENIILGNSNNKDFYKFLSALRRSSLESDSKFSIKDFRHELIKTIKENKNKLKTTYNFAIEIENSNIIDNINEYEYYNRDYDLNDELIELLFDINLPSNNLKKSTLLTKNEIVYCEYLPLPYIHVGNNFIGYSSKDNTDIFFDSGDIESIKRFMEIINYYFTKGIKHFYYYKTAKKRSYLDTIRLYKNAKEILGLPSILNDHIVLSNSKNKVYNVEKTISNLKTKSNISIVSNNLSKVFKYDPKISYLLIFSDIIKRHNIIPYFYLSKTRKNSFFIPYYKSIQNNSFIDEEIEKNYFYFGLSELQPHSFDYKIDLLPISYDKNLSNIIENRDFHLLFNPTDSLKKSDTFHFLSSLELFYLYSSYESLFESTSYYQLDKPISHHLKKTYVLYGEIFNAYSYDNKNFFFDIEDRDFIYNAYLLNYKLSNNLNFADPIIDKLTFGIPYILSSKLIDSIKNKKILSKSEFEELFAFKKKPNIENNIVFDSIFSKKDNLLILNEINSTVKHETIKQGLYIWDASSDEIDYILDFEDTSIEYDEFLNEINQIYYVYINKEVSGEVEIYTKPKKTLFFALLQEFTKGMSSLNRADIQKLLKLKYHIELLYDEDPNFIYKLINKINPKNRQKLFEYLETHTSFLNNSRLDLPYKIKKQEHVDFLIAFIIFVIHSLLKALCKYQNN